MRIIDLYNKIANDEKIPKKISYDDIEYEYNDYYEDYYSENYDRYLHHNGNLNDEIEIIEDTTKENKKIKKLTNRNACVDDIIRQFNNLIEKYDKEVNKLFQENKKLKEANKKLVKSNCEILQQRIDKATEYINNYMPNYDFDHYNLEKLLKILKGGKNE